MVRQLLAQVVAPGFLAALAARRLADHPPVAQCVALGDLAVVPAWEDLLQLAQRLLDIAKAAKVPVVGVTETQPANVAFQDWMVGELDALDNALTGPGS